VLLGRDHPRADVQGGHGAVAIEGTLVPAQFHVGCNAVA
jgi:hypothetical protein